MEHHGQRLAAPDPGWTVDTDVVIVGSGAAVRDLEFVQFHPTVAWLGPHSLGQQPLVSEAVRGEGAVLLDDAGVRFMAGQHELADLAPRDVVAKAILRRMRDTGAEHVWLDARAFGAEKWRVRFPTIHATLLSLGIDPVRDLIPVVPACHYASGGVRVDLLGEPAPPPDGALPDRVADVVDAAERPQLQRIMSEHAGVLRDLKGLDTVERALQDVPAGAGPATENWETSNLHAVASALVAAAKLREETRGSHWRDDFPARDDEHWRVHLDTVLVDGELRTERA